MDVAEAHTEKYLRHLGFTNIVHEPDGNVSPDFVLNGRIDGARHIVVRMPEQGG